MLKGRSGSSPDQLTLLVTWTGTAVATFLLGAIIWMVARHGFAQAGSYQWPVTALLDVSGFYAFAAVGAVVALRRPTNPVGWLFLVMGTAFLAQETTTQYAGRAYAGGASVTAFAVFVDWLSSWLWVIALACLAYVILLFPDGHPASSRWRWVGWLIGVAAGSQLIIQSAVMWRMRSPTTQLVDQPDEGVFFVVIVTLLSILGICLLAAGVSLVVRFRRSSGVERQQLRWMVAAGVAVIGALLVGAAADLTGSDALRLVTEVGGGVAIIGLPVAVGFAVLRYRLYDLDRIISRVVSYAIITIALGALYVAGVVGLGAVVRATAGGGGGDLVVAASTLAVAAMFQPLRRRVRALVDRRFNRARYDAQRTVEAFGQRLRDEVDLTALVDELGGTAAVVLHPRHVSVWLRGHEVTVVETA